MSSDILTTKSGSVGVPMYPKFLGVRTSGATIHLDLWPPQRGHTVFFVNVRAFGTATPAISQHYEYVDKPLRRCAWLGCKAPNQAILGVCKGWTEHSPTRRKHCCRLHTRLASQQRQRTMSRTFAGYQPDLTG